MISAGPDWEVAMHLVSEHGDPWAVGRQYAVNARLHARKHVIAASADISLHGDFWFGWNPGRIETVLEEEESHDSRA